MVKAKTVGTHDGIQRLFPRVPERRMTDVVYQGQSFYKINVQSQLCGHRSRNLRDFDGVRQPIAKMVGVPFCEDLGFILQPTKSARMNYAVSIALKFISIWMGGLGVTSATRLVGVHRVFSQHGKSLAAPQLEFKAHLVRGLET
jgi:hypothetical protein